MALQRRESPQPPQILTAGAATTNSRGGRGSQSALLIAHQCANGQNQAEKYWSVGAATPASELLLQAMTEQTKSIKLSARTSSFPIADAAIILIRYRLSSLRCVAPDVVLHSLPAMLLTIRSAQLEWV